MDNVSNFRPKSPALKKFLDFQLNSMKIGEVVFFYAYENFAKFHRIRMKSLVLLNVQNAELFISNSHSIM